MICYPLVLVDIDDVLIVGGGRVAERKAAGLLAAGLSGRLRLVSPQLSPALQEWALQGDLAITRRVYQPGDLAGAALVFAATDDHQVNRQVWQEARQRGIPVNVADAPALCTFHSPAVIRRGPLTVAINTAGASPALARRLRRVIEAAVGPEYGRLAELLGELRPSVRQCLPAGERPELWDGLIDTLLPLLAAGQEDAARRLLDGITPPLEPGS